MTVSFASWKGKQKMLQGWNKASTKAQAERGIPRIETLWMNYEVGQMML